MKNKVLALLGRLVQGKEASGEDTFRLSAGRPQWVIEGLVDDTEITEEIVLSYTGELEILSSTERPSVEETTTSSRAVPKIWTRAEIDNLLRTKNESVERGIITLFRLQTADEIRVGDTKHQNARGFNSAHARVGTRFARWLLGMDDHNVVRYPPKSLTHPRAASIFRRYVKNGNTVLDRAREICLLHSQQLTDTANGVLVVPSEK